MEEMELDVSLITPNKYFSSYEDLETHRLMLEDKPRNDAYKKAIFDNEEYFKDKVVMDVGCGTGILSIFCAQAGAKKVYAIEASNVAIIAKEIVRENKFEHIIEVIKCKVEDLVLPDNIKVDIIVSEWMGFYLLHEGMLDSVLVARDKFLKRNGQMFPDNACICVAPCSVPHLYSQWENVNGVSMSTFGKLLRAGKYNKPGILNIESSHLLGTKTVLCLIDLKNVTISELESFSIQHVTGANDSARYEGICLWFECTFPSLTANGQEEGAGVILSTSPDSPPTHWKQTVIVLPEGQEMEEGEPIAFKLDMKRDKKNRRWYNLEATLLDPYTLPHPIPCTCYATKCILIKVIMLESQSANDGE